MKRLKVSIVSSHDVNENDDKIKELFEQLLDDLKKEYPSTPYSKVDFIEFSFTDDEGLIERDCIVSINPAKYIISKKKLGDNLIPLFAVKKAYQKDPYFPSFFIANEISEIDSIRSSNIKRLYVVSKNSTSGFIAPIFKLWESGIIDSPNEAGVLKKGWEIKFVGSHKEVEQRIVEDNYAIGATGQYTGQEDFNKMIVKVLLRYYYLPQDTLAISSNLKPYKEFIENWFLSIFSKDSKYIDIFFNSSSRITGLHSFSDEFNNALNELEIMTQYVHDFKKVESRDAKDDINVLKISGKVKSLLANNKIPEAIKILVDHLSLSPDENKDALDDLILYSAEYNRLSRKSALLISNEDSRLRINNIIHSLIRIVNELGSI